MSAVFVSYKREDDVRVGRLMRDWNSKGCPSGGIKALAEANHGASRSRRRSRAPIASSWFGRTRASDRR